MQARSKRSPGRDRGRADKGDRAQQVTGGCRTERVRDVDALAKLGCRVQVGAERAAGEGLHAVASTHPNACQQNDRCASACMQDLHDRPRRHEHSMQPGMALPRARQQPGEHAGGRMRSRAWMRSAAVASPLAQSACATRCSCSAWNPPWCISASAKLRHASSCASAHGLSA